MFESRTAICYHDRSGVTVTDSQALETVMFSQSMAPGRPAVVLVGVCRTNKTEASAAN